MKLFQNTTVIGGTYHKHKVRLPGAGRASDIATMVSEVFIILKQSLQDLNNRTTKAHQ